MSRAVPSVSTATTRRPPLTGPALLPTSAHGLPYSFDLGQLPVPIWAVLLSFLGARTIPTLRLIQKSIARLLGVGGAADVLYVGALLKTPYAALLSNLLQSHDSNCRRAFAHATMDVRWHYQGAKIGPILIDSKGEPLSFPIEPLAARRRVISGRVVAHDKVYLAKGFEVTTDGSLTATRRYGAPPLCCSGRSYGSLNGLRLAVSPSSAVSCFNISACGRAVRMALPRKISSTSMHGRWLRLRATGPALPACGRDYAAAFGAQHSIVIRLSNVQRVFVGCCSDRFDPLIDPTADRWTYASNGVISNGTHLVGRATAADSVQSIEYRDCVLRIVLDLRRGTVSFRGGDHGNDNQRAFELRRSRGGDNTSGLPLGSHACGPLRGKPVLLKLPESQESSREEGEAPRLYYFLIGTFFTRNNASNQIVAEIISYDVEND